MKQITLTLALWLLMAGNTLAANSWHSSKVTKIYPYGDGKFVITFEEDALGCNNASSPKYHFVAVGQNGVTADGIDKLFTTALAAALSGKNLSIYWDDSSSSCYVNRLQIQL